MKEFAFKLNGAEYKCAVEEIEAGKTKVTVNGKVYEVETEAAAPAAKPGASSQSNGKSGLRLEGQNSSTPTIQNTPSTPEQKPAPAPSPADDTAAIAFALYLASRDGKHDAPTGMIAVQARETAWNTKSIGLNNVGF